jgi:gliding motility-associated-like protein
MLIHQAASAQLSVVDQNVNFMVQKLLLCDKIKVSNISFKGDMQMIGNFDGSKSNIGLKNGIIMSSGKAKDAIGPNNNAGSGGSNFSVANDPDLQILAGSSTCNEAAVLEFDFVPLTDSVSIKYVFASEEYLEYANTSFNDVFGFFLSGPGINGTFSNGAVNLATVPGTTTPVSVNSINDTKNSGLYIDNGNGQSGTPQYSNNTVTQFDGFTKVLVGRYAVTPGQTYHIKLAIADVSDGIYDSAVFLQAGSFFSNFFDVNQIVTYPELYEGCDSAMVNFQMKPFMYNVGKIPITIYGTATNGVDYVKIPDSITVNPVTGKASFRVVPLKDNVNDDLEKVNVILHTSACSDDTLHFTIREFKPLVVTDYDTLFCGGTITLSSKFSGGNLPTIDWDFDHSNKKTINVNPGWNTTEYTYVVDDHCHQGPKIGKVRAVVNNKKPDAGPDQKYCSGPPVNIGGSTTAGYTYTWTPSIDVANPNTLSTTATILNVSNTKSVNSLVVESDNGMCQAKDTVVLTVIPLPQAIIDPVPYVDCPVFKSAMKENSIVADSAVYTWSTSAGEILTGKNAALTFATPGSYDVFLEVKNYNMCSSKDNALNHVIIQPKPTADFTVDNYEINMLYPTVTVSSSPTDADTCFMRIYSEKGALVYEPRYCDFTYEIPTTGNNKFIQYVTAANGCKDTLVRNVYVKPEYFVWVPNAFTINGDGVNEEFKVYYSWAIEDFNFYIFDRWGQELFHGTGDGRSVTWDGKTKNGDLQPIGVYVYMYTYNKPVRGDMNEAVRELGTVTIIR